MKKILTYGTQLILNLLLFGLAIGLYRYFLLPYSAHTALPDHFLEIVAVVLLMVFLPLFSLKRFKPLPFINFGFSPLLVLGILFLIVFLNQSYSQRAYKRNYPIEAFKIQNGRKVLEVYIYEKGRRLNFSCDNENCFRDDSVKVNITQGLFGFLVVSPTVEPIRKSECL